MKTNNEVSQAQALYTEKASLYQKVYISFLQWGKELHAFFGKSNYLQPHLKILDAGCGTGIVTRTLYQLAKEKGIEGIQFYAFDLTLNMLKNFQQWIKAEDADNIELAQSDVLDPKVLPSHWRDFDLIVCSEMLEYLSRDKVKDAIANLKQLLKKEGVLLIFITKRNWLTWWFAGVWWKANLYNKAEIQKAILDAGFKEITFKKFAWVLTRVWSSSSMAIELKKEK
jgi:ubiquinone/menaquinone biosynthesis C-methylase UbiE